MRSKRSALRAIAVVAMVGLVAAACGKSGTSGGGGGGGGQTVKIAFFGALSGDYKLLAIHGYQAAQLAFEQANAKGDLPVKVELVPEDTQGSGDQASPLADKVVGDPSFVGVIGPAFSGESAATGDKFDQAGLPFVTPSATDDALATHGWTHWFRAVGNNSDEAKPSGLYIQNVIKPNCTFVASDGSAYGHGLAAIVFNVLTDAGQPVQKEEQVAPGQKDYSALVTKIGDSGCKAVFYGGYSPEGGLIAKQMKEAGVDATMVGGDGLKDDTFLSTAGGAGEGTISMCPCVSPADLAEGSAVADQIQKLITDYKAKFGQDPGIYAAEGWDVAQIFIAAFKAGKTSRQDITDYIKQLNGFQGLAKTYSWQPDGELFPADRTMYAYEDKGGEWSFLGNAADVTAPAA
ncbi:MAG TPA: branched-chain amino acid ABC transporter substrate-binding protein [Actinomycetota bacterium]|nr:branched-chain amino acid ABC transporter substrate-binding protein [Actinomycetota bacterium]